MSDKPVFRLLDMEVEEISLVDRAANKHRFLLVKRSDMNETEEDSTNEDVADDGDEAEDSEEESGESDEGTDAGEDDDSTTSGEEAPADPEIVTAAVEALAKLTGIVEALGTKGATLATTQDELRALAEQLGKAVGGARKPAKRKPAPPPVDDEDEDQEDEDIDKSSLAEVRAAFDRVQDLLVRGAKRTKGGKPRKPATKRGARAVDEAIATKLDAVLTQLSAFSSTNKAQAQRLSRLEKQSGMPNSAPVGERPPKGGAEDEEVLWSLDLNKPDRASADKTVSFFDES